MELPDFQESPTDQSLVRFSTLEDENMTDWSVEENKMFENALAEFDHSSPSFFENVASKVPWKSIAEVKKHYKALVEDIEMIESGLVPIPNYHETTTHDSLADDSEKKIENPSSSQPKGKNNSHHQRRKGVPWTEEEHKLFLMGLNKYGKGDWRSISRYYVVTKNPTQVASHAQKFFRRKNSSTPADRRRPSIHDIQTVSSTSASPPERHRNPPSPRELSSTSISVLPDYGLQPPMYDHNINRKHMHGHEVMVPPPLPIASSIINQPLYGAYPSIFTLPFDPGNQQWK